MKHLNRNASLESRDPHERFESRPRRDLRVRRLVCLLRHQNSDLIRFDLGQHPPDVIEHGGQSLGSFKKRRRLEALMRVVDEGPIFGYSKHYLVLLAPDTEGAGHFAPKVA
jgi:hypothetical protein